MAINTMKDLFVHELKDLYSAEKQLTKALPRMIKAAANSQLQEAITSHLEETEEHVRRLEEIFEAMSISTRGAKCDGMEGLIKEAQKVVKEADEPVRDAAIIAAAQRIEHYEIAAYGCAKAFAELLEQSDAIELLQTTLDEESAANEKLNDIANSEVNEEALGSNEDILYEDESELEEAR
jgi:ferritin-like metal-binding protein YciE